MAGLALLRVIHIVVPMLTPSAMDAVLMFTFGLARGIPIVVAGTAAGSLAHLRHTRPFTLWTERAGGALMLAAALYFLYQAAFYAGWLPL